VYHCVSLCITVCHCVSLCITFCHCVSLCITVCHCLSLCITVCHCVSLCVTVCHCVHFISTLVVETSLSSVNLPITTFDSMPDPPSSAHPTHQHTHSLPPLSATNHVKHHRHCCMQYLYYSTMARATETGKLIDAELQGSQGTHMKVSVSSLESLALALASPQTRSSAALTTPRPNYLYSARLLIIALTSRTVCCLMPMSVPCQQIPLLKHTPWFHTKHHAPRWLLVA
jgi:hypothetical protein